MNVKCEHDVALLHDFGFEFNMFESIPVWLYPPLHAQAERARMEMRNTHARAIHEVCSVTYQNSVTA